jgi:hypothetical protein
MESILSSTRKDWAFIILSPIAGFILVGLYFLLLNLQFTEEIALLVVLIFYSVLFDVRHLFSTYTRTLFDKQFMKVNKKWFNRSWLVILILPLLFFFAISTGEFGAYKSQIVLSFAARMTFILGFYHLIKQNWGFMAIYKKKMNEPEDGSDRWDKLMLISGSFIPFVIVSMVYPVWFAGEQAAFNPSVEEYYYVLDTWKEISIACLVISGIFLLVGFALKVIPQYKYVSRNIGFLFLGAFLLIQLITKNGSNTLLSGVLLLLIFIFVLSSIMSISKAIKFGKFNQGKWAVLISSLVLYNGILLIPVDQKYLLIMAVTIPHNIQYLAFVNFFNQKYYSNPKLDFGWARKLTERFGLFLMISLIYAILFEGMRTGARYMPIENGNDSLFLIRNAVAIFFISMVLHHYYLDAVIWRVRKDKDLSDKV